MGPTPVYRARAEKLQNADFAMKQTNICRLSGDINKAIVKDPTIPHKRRCTINRKVLLLDLNTEDYKIVCRSVCSVPVFKRIPSDFGSG